MIVIVYLVGLSLFLGASGLAVFLWALKHGQFEDLDGAASRILYDGRATSTGGASSRKSCRLFG